MAEVTGMTPEKIAQEITNVKSYVDGGLSEKADKNQVTSELSKKADKTQVTSELSKKADKTQVASDLSKKADKTQVASDLSKKANTTYVDSELSKKADVTYVDSLSPLKSFAGSGSPEGKVSAPVGSIYTDYEATNGAIRWVKTSGIGNTGWVVEYGDTGWRKIDGSDGEYLQEGEYLVRREGRRLWVILSGVVFRERNSNSSLGRLPWLFRGVPFTMRFPVYAGLENTPTLSGNISRLGYVNIYGTKTDTPATGHICTATDEAWPTSLPGTPA